MRDKPDGPDLLKLARRILRNQLLKHIPAEDKYSALMVANVMAIAARQMENGDAFEREELTRLNDLLSNDVASLDEGYRVLSAEIRAGEIEPGTERHKSVYQLLLDQAREKVRESNPGYLEE